MRRTARSLAIAVTATVTAVATAALAVPAGAVTIPTWPTAGRVPVGCDPLVQMGPIVGPTWTYGFTDSGFPTVTSAVLSNNTTRVTVLPPAGATVITTIKRTELCSGGAEFALYTMVNMATGSGIERLATQSTPDAFTQTLTAQDLFLPSQVGPYRFAAITNSRRYDSMSLDQDYRLVSSVPSSQRSYSTGAVTLTPSYLLRATTLSNALSATRVVKGRTVKATAQLTMATDAGYVADAGARVYAQTRIGTGAWTTRSALTANASGVVTYSFVVAATTQVRFVHNTLLSGNYTNGVISAVKVVTKI